LHQLPGNCLLDLWWVRLAAVGGIMFGRKSLPEGQPDERRKDMTEGQREAPDRPEAERYYAQHASLDVGEGGTAEAALQEAINEGARQSWKLVGVTQDPMSGGVILVWDTSGFFSG
jgi:hypothetical protein